MKERMFGVEIECGVPKLREEEEESLFAFTQRAITEAKLSRDWGHTWDGTMIELKSPPMAGRSGFAELQRMFSFLLENEAYVTRSDGLHVHHDAPEYIDNYDLVLKLVESWVANIGSVHCFVDTYRYLGEGRWACPEWNSDRVTGYKNGTRAKEGIVAESRRDLNTAALNKHGTIELRLHEGTLDFSQAEAWIRFGQAMLNRVPRLKNPLPTADTPEQLLKNLLVTRRIRKQLQSRVDGLIRTDVRDYSNPSMSVWA